MPSPKLVKGLGVKNKVAIVGCAERTRDDVDYNDPDLDIWVLNESAIKPWCKRADAVLQVHQEAVWRSPVNRGDPGHGEWLESGDTPPVYMLEKYPDVPNAIKYPMAEIVEKYLGNLTVDSERGRKDYFTSTIAYAFALVTYLGYKEVHTYGIELADEDEYKNQLPAAMFWTGIALGQGIKWVSHSNMFDAPLYPVETFVGLDKSEFSKMVAALAPKREIAQKMYMEAKEACFKAIQTYEDTAAPRHKEAMEKSIHDISKAGSDFGLIDGAMQENERFFQRSSAMEKRTGTYVFSTHEFARDQASVGMTRERETTDYRNLGVKGQSIINRIAAKEKKFDSERRKLFEALREFIEEFVRISVRLGMYTGAINEDERFMAILEENKKKVFEEGVTL